MMKKKNVVDLAGVRRGDAHLERAKQIDPSVTDRPVPLGEILEQNTYSVKEASIVTGFHPETLRRAIRSGALKAVQPAGSKGGEYRISRTELAAWWRSKGGGDLFAKAGQQ